MIPLSIPFINGNEWKYVKECLDTGWVSSAGKYVNQFENMVAQFAGVKYGVACMNGTAGLHISQVLVGVESRHYVIAPNITFIATLNSIKYTGADPILIDIDPESWQMDLNLLSHFLESETFLDTAGDCRLKRNNRIVKAIMPVHVLGNMTNMNLLMQIADAFHLSVIEDSTEALGSFYDSTHAGGFGELGVFSFNGNKIITTGGGGVIVTNNEDFAKRAKHLTTQAKVNPDDYIHDAIGYNYRLVNVLAALGVAQLESLLLFVKRKKYIDKYYRAELSGIGDISFQFIEEKVDPNCWLFTISTSKMTQLLSYLNHSSIQSRPLWMPMNQLKMFQNDIYISEHDHSDTKYRTCLSIPSSLTLTDEQLELVVKKIKSFY
jgi:aminotransferase in exopolysaccharide biosynthesis